MSEENISETLNVIMLGDSSVGKSTLARRFTYDIFEENLSATLGIELYKKVVTIDEEKYLYKIWDTCGQERFRAISKNYYRTADGVMVLFSLSCQKSLENVSEWIKSIKENNDDDVPIIIIGTKSDLPKTIDENTITYLENTHHIYLKHIECSAKDNYNVELVFMELAKQIALLKKRERIKKEATKKEITHIHLQEETKPKKKKCCGKEKS